MDLGPHAFFIVAAHAATAVIVGGLVLRAMLDNRAQLRALAELEGRGMRRRSSNIKPSLLTGSENESGRRARAIPGERTV